MLRNATLRPPGWPQQRPQPAQYQTFCKRLLCPQIHDVNAKLDEAAFYIERNPTLVKSITSFPYIAKSL
jgi:hypothetical protein